MGHDHLYLCVRIHQPIIELEDSLIYCWEIGWGGTWDEEALPNPFLFGY